MLDQLGQIFFCPHRVDGGLQNLNGPQELLKQLPSLGGDAPVFCALRSLRNRRWQRLTTKEFRQVPDRVAQLNVVLTRNYGDLLRQRGRHIPDTGFEFREHANEIGSLEVFVRRSEVSRTWPFPKSTRVACDVRRQAIDGSPRGPILSLDSLDPLMPLKAPMRHRCSSRLGTD